MSDLKIHLRHTQATRKAFARSAYKLLQRIQNELDHNSFTVREIVDEDLDGGNIRMDDKGRTEYVRKSLHFLMHNELVEKSEPNTGRQHIYSLTQAGRNFTYIYY